MPTVRRMKKADWNPAALAPAIGATAQRPWAQVGVVFLLALAARGLHLWSMRHTLVYQVLLGDAWEYDRWAQQIAAGNWLGNEVFYQTPLYPYFLAIVYKTFGHDIWAVRLVQAVLGSLACVFLARAGSKFFSERVGWLAGLILALYPPAIFFDGIVQKATLDLLLMTALLWTLGTAGEQPRWTSFAASGLLLGALILNRENAVVLVPVVLAWTAWVAWREPLRTPLALGSAFCGATALVLLPVGLRNLYVGGELLLTTSQMGTNFYIGNHSGADGRYAPLRALRGDARYERDDARLLAERATGQPMTPREVSRYWLSEAWADVTYDPARWLRLLAWKWFLTWHRVEVMDSEGMGVHQEHSPLLWALGWCLNFGVLVPLAALGAWWTRGAWRRLWLLYAMAISFAAAVTLFFVFARYRFPLAPLITLFAAAGLCGIGDRLRSRDSKAVRELLIGLAIAGTAAAFCNWPFAGASDGEATYTNIGRALLDLGRPADAVEPLQRAIDIAPEFLPAYLDLGEARQAMGDAPEAQHCFEQAVRIAPRSAIAQYSLGRQLEKQGESARAIGIYQQAIALDPQFSQPHWRSGASNWRAATPMPP